MNSYLLNLRSLLDLEKWKQIQDEIAGVTGMAIITVDYKGVPATKHSSCRKFCQMMRSDPQTARYCQKCDSRGGLEAVRLNEPYIYLCHSDVVDVAIPINIDEKYIGAVMAGQVLLETKEEEQSLEKISVRAYNEDLLHSNDVLSQYYNELPRMSLKRIKTIADMLQCLCNYIVEEAINKNMLIEVCEQMSQKKVGFNFANDLSGYPLDVMMDVKKQVTKAITTKQIDIFEENEIPMPHNPTLRPAIEYISKHKNENVTLNQMAKLCHTSEGYFSRLFKKEMGENFSDYVSRMKINLSKKLLETTDLSVTEISNDLGFSDAGYFIKRFKKQEGITPALFRKYLK